MDPLTVPLTPEELDALRRIPRDVISPAMRDRLIELRLVTQKLGGLALTDAGEMRVHLGR
jgi:hypothetical protein